jgi:2-keto-4-pentenoate hydratase/2-oxohepta-3-ene-1,7-dioic acid hydratase in catechol pathway
VRPGRRQVELPAGCRAGDLRRRAWDRHWQDLHRTSRPEEAAEAILGYTCVNDLTSLDILNADPSFPQWTRAKSFDGFGVVGPVIDTDVNWRDLTIRTLVNDRERQSYQASDMIFSPHEIVSLLSQDMTLNPGDLIACGTSLGARPIKPGMVVEVVIEGIGGVGVTLTAPTSQDGPTDTD